MNQFRNYKGVTYYQASSLAVVSVVETPVSIRNAFPFTLAISQFDKKRIKERLMSYRNIPENWDGNNAIPPSDRVINTAMAFIDYADARELPIILFENNQPTSHGTVEFEIEDGNDKICIEFGNFSYLVFIERDSGETYVHEQKFALGESMKFHDVIRETRLLKHE